MSKVHEKLIADQFGPRAKAYVESAVHSQGEDLAALAGIVERAAPVHAIDLGAGGGHVSYLMAKYAKSVTALDLSSEMLAAVAATAKEKGLANIATARGGAERLPFDDATFDFVASRFSAHHWRDFEQGLGEARRVAKAGSPAVFIDVFAPGRAMLDTHLQAVELLRDGSHVRDYTAAEWLGALGRRGFLPGLPKLQAAHGFSGLDRAYEHSREPRQRDPHASGLAPPRSSNILGSRRMGRSGSTF